MSKHAKGDTLPDLEPITQDVKFTVNDSQELAVIVEPSKRAVVWADAMQKANRLTLDSYWAACDAFVAGWMACEDLYEGRHRS